MMALIKCPECGADVSERAKSCPKCGFPIRKNIELECYCPKCEKKISIKGDNCPNCGFPIAKGEEIFLCPKCHSSEIDAMLNDWPDGKVTFAVGCDNLDCAEWGVDIPKEEANQYLIYKNIRKAFFEDCEIREDVFAGKKGIIYCPYCHSALVRPAKGIWEKGTLWNQHQWHCNNCDSDF